MLEHLRPTNNINIQLALYAFIILSYYMFLFSNNYIKAIIVHFKDNIENVSTSEGQK